MIKKIKVAEAVGLPLLHDITAIMPDGFKGVMYKRGQVIRESDIEGLKNIGKEHIYVGTLDENQVHEEDAILAISPYLADINIEISTVSEGKVTLRAKQEGLFVIDRAGLKALHSVGDYTLPTIRSYSAVKKGDRLVGARIVPLWTDRETVNRALAVVKKFQPIFQVVRYKKLKVGCIITGDEVYYGRIQDAFQPVLEEKLRAFDADILGYEFCPDDMETIVQAFANFKAQGADLVLFTGGMSVDPDDTTPNAIRQTGARVIVQGIPMQPGNMLMVAKLGETYLVGVPGASIHSKKTSFDVFLPRIFAGLDLKKEDFFEMAEGGLL
uniref:molybdopterin-binding protein n=1 Tax=Ndongobacter massiliensis TaxID=1871025 RepID=UPI0009F80E6B|nr:molybdopterin-binding protein [Ndongobacter massiliensis]